MTVCVDMGHVPLSNWYGAGQLELVTSGQCVTASDVLDDAMVRFTAAHKGNKHLCKLLLCSTSIRVLE